LFFATTAELLPSRQPNDDSVEPIQALRTSAKITGKIASTDFIYSPG